MTKMMTERQAWSYLARRWEAAKRSKDWEYWSDQHEYWATIFSEKYLGLCLAIDHLYHLDKIDQTTRTRMMAVISKEPKRFQLFCWSYLTPGGKRARAAFCRRQAARLAKK